MGSRKSSPSDRCFGGGTYTEKGYIKFIESALRRAWLRWPPRRHALDSARRPSQRQDKTKWEYQCASCLNWFTHKEGLEVDHIEPCGSPLNSAYYLGKLFCEEDNLRVLCKPCHSTLRVASLENTRK